jgi:hypothetical protein
MKINRFYITGNVAGCTQKEAIEKLLPIELQLRKIGATNIFNTSSIDRELLFQDEMKIRMEELANADVVVFGYDWNSGVESKLEFMEASRLAKHIRMDRLGDYRDIQKNLLEG